MLKRADDAVNILSHYRASSAPSILVELVKSWLAPIDLTNPNAWRNEMAGIANSHTKVRRECPLPAEMAVAQRLSQTEVFASEPYSCDARTPNCTSPGGRTKTQP